MKIKIINIILIFYNSMEEKLKFKKQQFNLNKNYILSMMKIKKVLYYIPNFL